MTGVVEGRLERGEGSSRVPVRVGNDGDGLIEAHDALHARHRLGRGGIDGRELAAVDRRDLDRGVEHARQFEIDAIDRAAVTAAAKRADALNTCYPYPPHAPQPRSDHDLQAPVKLFRREMTKQSSMM